MNVSDAVASRLTVRVFQDRPVDGELLRTIMSKATRAASGGNVQPWNFCVLGGRELSGFREVMEKRMEQGGTDEPEYAVYPPKLKEPYRTRRFELGEDMYVKLGIARDDRPARLEWLKNNYRFFGAPVGMFCFVDRCMGAPQWSDLGMYLATFALLLREAGLDCCFQEAWANYAKTVEEYIKPDPEHMLFCGVGVGYRDTEAPVNHLESKRAPIEEIASFRGI